MNPRLNHGPLKFCDIGPLGNRSTSSGEARIKIQGGKLKTQLFFIKKVLRRENGEKMGKEKKLEKNTK